MICNHLQRINKIWKIAILDKQPRDLSQLQGSSVEVLVIMQVDGWMDGEMDRIDKYWWRCRSWGWLAGNANEMCAMRRALEIDRSLRTIFLRRADSSVNPHERAIQISLAAEWTVVKFIANTF